MSEKKSLVKHAKETVERVAAEQLKKQAELRKLRGSFHWEGDLEDMRTDSQQLQDWYDSQYDRKNS